MSRSLKGKDVPLDLASVIGCKAEEPDIDLEWATPYSDYAFLSGEFVDAICAAARASATTPELQAAVESKLYDTVTDLSVIARLALDLRNIRESGGHALYDKSSSGWLQFLDESGKDPGRLVDRGGWHFRANAGMVANSKRFARRVYIDAVTGILPKEGRHDVLSRNGLLEEYFTSTHARRIDISPNYRDWTAPSEPHLSVRPVIAAMVNAFEKAAAPAILGDQGLAAATRVLAHDVIVRHISRSWADLGRVRKLFTGRRAGDFLTGGTPKHIGRLHSWHYQQLGKQVVRFAHGGERAFYDDYIWSLAELPYCDRYYCHSKTEASHVNRRRLEGRMADTRMPDLTFESLGSIRHRTLLERCRSNSHRERNGVIMYVSGAYIGEAAGDFPTRKPPDALYFEWQAWLLDVLRKKGRKVITKVHPKGIHVEGSALGRYSDDIAAGFFAADKHNVDCYVFDFAGSAFFDALASRQGVVLLDLGARPHDPHSFADLRQRCEIVDCTFSDQNTFRLDRYELEGAIERASERRDWPDEFFDAYFG